jgi:hypothetical protein
VEEVGEKFLGSLVGIHDGRGVVFQERCDMEGGGSVSVEEESGMGSWRGECCEVHCLLRPLGGIRRGIGGLRPMGEAWVMIWVDHRFSRTGRLMDRDRGSGHVGCCKIIGLRRGEVVRR